MTGTVYLSCDGNLQIRGIQATCYSPSGFSYYNPASATTTTTTPPDYSAIIANEDVAAVFSWGFGVVLLFWSLGFAIGAARTVIFKL